MASTFKKLWQVEQALRIRERDLQLQQEREKEGTEEVGKEYAEQKGEEVSDVDWIAMWKKDDMCIVLDCKAKSLLDLNGHIATIHGWVGIENKWQIEVDGKHFRVPIRCIRKLLAEEEVVAEGIASEKKERAEEKEKKEREEKEKKEREEKGKREKGGEEVEI